ncbi:MAG: response regulator [Candidatus Hermodarchaeota archaeon]
MMSRGFILCIEDDVVDVWIIRRAFKELNRPNTLVVVENGEEAWTYLRTSEIRPNLILLDLQTHEMDGLAFLQALKQHVMFKKIPVIVFTTSDEELDIQESYRWGAAGYVVKPLEYAQYVETLRVIMMYWTYCKLPRAIESIDRASLPAKDGNMNSSYQPVCRDRE